MKSKGSNGLAKQKLTQKVQMDSKSLKWTQKSLKREHELATLKMRVQCTHSNRTQKAQISAQMYKPQMDKAQMDVRLKLVPKSQMDSKDSNGLKKA